MITDIFLKVIQTDEDGTMTACYPQETIEAAHEAFEAVKEHFKEINKKFTVTIEEDDSFEALDQNVDFWFCVRIVEQPRMSVPAIVEELEVDGFFD